MTIMIKPLCCLLLLVLCACASADMKTAKRAAQTGNYPEAHRQLTLLADFGLPEAQIELAQLYARGQGVAPDCAVALALLEKAEAQGAVRALFEKGRLYQGSSRTAACPRDAAKALSYYETAAARGYDPARIAYQKGDLAEDRKRYKEARELYQAAWDGGYARAAQRLGRLYERGRGVKTDPVAAGMWYDRARQAGLDAPGSAPASDVSPPESLAPAGDME